jgi:8-oxo-dGTP pyrophosphatase MutT (NUDIX family)
MARRTGNPSAAVFARATLRHPGRASLRASRVLLPARIDIKNDLDRNVAEGTYFMRQSESAVALICRQADDGQTRWLARWNVRWQAFHFVAGHRCSEESFRACLEREIAEELGLRESSEYSISSSPPLHLDFTAWSVSAGEETRYIMELFFVELGPAAQSRVAGDSENRWLGEAAIRGGRSDDGRPISATMGRLLTDGRLWRDVCPR